MDDGFCYTGVLEDVLAHVGVLCLVLATGSLQGKSGLRNQAQCGRRTNLKTLLVVAWALAYGDDEAEAALLRLFALSLPMFGMFGMSRRR